ncbi:MAG: penicillin-binding protein 2 [Bacilli bacterium]|nr:penicillin-binding protein 2 [Bacilli bacterium]
MAKKKLNYNRKKKVVINSKVLNHRLMFFLVIVIILFTLIFLRLFKVMLLENKKYNYTLDKLTYTEVLGSSAPRGRIYDRNHNLLVDNKAVKTIYYKKDKKTTTEEELDLSYIVSKNINIDYDKTTESMKREFFLAKNKDICKKKITKEEWQKLEERKLTSQQIEKLKKERITDEELSSLQEEDTKAAYLYYLMNKGYTYDEKIIKSEDVSDEEYAYIAEHAQELPGFNTKLDWDRVYLYGDTFRSILGTVSSTTQGIPSDNKEEYLKNGYLLSDRVGLSYLEKQYETYLKGKKEKYRVINRHELALIEEGKRGNDIVLSIDINLQREVENILAEEVIKTKSEPNTQYYDHSFVIIQDPKTGEILAMAGKRAVYENGGYIAKDYTPASLTSPMTPGSVVKAASMLVGYNQNAIKIGEYMVDECIKIAATKEKCSWKTLGRINDIEALALSSNVYQFKTAIRVAGSSYEYNKGLTVKPETFKTYRDMYHSFGLGVKTGIDLPIESSGYTSNSTKAGNLLDFVMGQFETYTPIQLSQYATTLANGGSRLEPHLLKEVHESTNSIELGKTIKTVDKKVLNTIDTKSEYMARVKEGLHAVTMSSYGLGRNYIDAKYDPSGKTGTSQSFIDTDNDGVIDTETISTAFIGYAPTNDPKISIVVTSPDSSHPNSNIDYNSLVTLHITKKVTNKYFEMYPLN